MLPHEIEPFADHHIEKLGQTIKLLQAVKANSRLTEVLTQSIPSVDVNELIKTAQDSKQALIRFKICMADEVKQKDRYSKYAKEHGYPFS